MIRIDKVEVENRQHYESPIGWKVKDVRIGEDGKGCVVLERDEDQHEMGRRLERHYEETVTARLKATLEARYADENASMLALKQKMEQMGAFWDFIQVYPLGVYYRYKFNRWAVENSNTKNILNHIKEDVFRYYWWINGKICLGNNEEAAEHVGSCYKTKEECAAAHATVHAENLAMIEKEKQAAQQKEIDKAIAYLKKHGYGVQQISVST